MSRLVQTFPKDASSASERRWWAAHTVAAVVLGIAYFAIHDWSAVVTLDSRAYCVLMGHHPFEAAFWHKFTAGFRNYTTVPLVYALFDPSRLDSLVVLQTVLSFAAWLAFAAAVGSFFSTSRARLAVFVLVALGLFSRGYFRFDEFVLSDSLAWSFVLLWFAATLRYDLLRSARARFTSVPLEIPGYFVLTLATTCARDANALLLLGAVPMVLPLVLERRLTWRQALPIPVAVIVSLVFNQVTARERQTLNMANVIAGVVLQKPEVLDYFVAHGMPRPPPTANFKLVEPQDSLRKITDDQPLVVERLRAVEQSVLHSVPRFLFSSARSVYTRWLVTHPGYVLGNVRESWDVMFEQWSGDRERHLDPDGRPDVLPFVVWFDALPTAWMLVFTALLALLGASLGRGEGWRVLLSGAALAVTGFANAVIGFHGDVWELSEMSRHAWIGNLALHLGLAMMVLGASHRLWMRSRATS